VEMRGRREEEREIEQKNCEFLLSESIVPL
jgi:hypothetical protein